MKFYYVTLASIAFNAAFLLGCVTAPQFAPAKAGNTLHSRATSLEIEVYRSKAPTKKFEEIGTVSVCCSTKIDKAIDRLRESAAQNGGDALIGLDAMADGTVIATVIRFL